MTNCKTSASKMNILLLKFKAINMQFSVYITRVIFYQNNCNIICSKII